MQRSKWTAAVAAVAAVSTLGAGRLSAQSAAIDPQCTAAARPLQDACQKSIDLFDFLAPQLGTAVAGGNAVIGQGGAFGRVGRFSLALRATAFNGALPDVASASVSTGGPTRSNFAVNDQYIGAPAADLALAVFPGFGLGPVRVGALDALGTATYIPEYDGDDIAVTTPDGSLKLGYGARLGLVQETAVVPGVAVTYLRRDLPEVSVVGALAASGSQANDTLGVRNLQVETQAWRVVAGKKFFIVAIAAGAGQDRYESRGRLGAVVNESVLGFPVSRFQAEDVQFSQTLTRTNYFADVSLDLPGIKLSGEVGRVEGGRVRESYNSFDDGRARGDDSRLYFAAALRFGF